MTFEDEQHFIFPDSNLKDSDNWNTSKFLSDKTKRDSYFYFANEDRNNYNYQETYWK